MNIKKPVYLLAGGRSTSHEMFAYLIQSVFRESGAVSPTIAYVGTANDDDESFFNRMAGIFREVGAYKVTHAMISPRRANLKKAQDILKSAEIVFISGGDVERGMQILKEKNMTDFLFELYEQGKLIFGSSAGSVMLAKEWVRWRDPDDDSTAELFPCLGFAPLICDTHDELDGWQELKTVLRLKQDNTKGYGIVSGTAAKVFPDGRVEALGGAIQQYIRHGRRVYKSSDILPVSNKDRD